MSLVATWSNLLINHFKLNMIWSSDLPTSFGAEFYYFFLGESIIFQLDDKKNHKTKDRLGYIKKYNSKLICGKKYHNFIILH